MKKNILRPKINGKDTVGVEEKLPSQRGASSLSQNKLENTLLPPRVRCPWKTLKEQTEATKQEPLKGKRKEHVCLCVCACVRVPACVLGFNGTFIDNQTEAITQHEN